MGSSLFVSSAFLIAFIMVVLHRERKFHFETCFLIKKLVASFSPLTHAPVHFLCWVLFKFLSYPFIEDNLIYHLYFFPCDRKTKTKWYKPFFM